MNIIGPPVVFAMSSSHSLDVQVARFELRGGVLFWNALLAGKLRSDVDLGRGNHDTWYLPPCYTICARDALRESFHTDLLRLHGRAVKSLDTLRVLKHLAPKVLDAQPMEIRDALAALVLLEGT